VPGQSSTTPAVADPQGRRRCGLRGRLARSRRQEANIESMEKLRQNLMSRLQPRQAPVQSLHTTRGTFPSIASVRSYTDSSPNQLLEFEARATTAWGSSRPSRRSPGRADRLRRAAGDSRATCGAIARPPDRGDSLPCPISAHQRARPAARRALARATPGRGRRAPSGHRRCRRRRQNRAACHAESQAGQGRAQGTRT